MKVSIVIPCHNCSLTINRAVESVFSQTLTDWEVILINNNSDDDTWDKLLEIKRRNPHKSITILTEEKKGAPAARNRGLYEARGEWIQFLDADDELLPVKLESQLNLKAVNIADVICGSYIKIKELEGKTSKKYIDVNSDLWTALLSTSAGITSANLFRRKAVLSIGGWNEVMTSSQEYELMFRLVKNKGRFEFSNEPLTIIHFTENSITNSKDINKLSQRLNNFAKLRTEMLAQLRSRPDYKKYVNLFNTIFTRACFWYYHQGLQSSIIIYNQFTKDTILKRLKTNYKFMILVLRTKLGVSKN